MFKKKQLKWRDRRVFDPIENIGFRREGVYSYHLDNKTRISYVERQQNLVITNIAGTTSIITPYLFDTVIYTEHLTQELEKINKYINMRIVHGMYKTCNIIAQRKELIKTVERIRKDLGEILEIQTEALILGSKYENINNFVKEDLVKIQQDWNDFISTLKGIEQEFDDYYNQIVPASLRRKGK